MVPPSIRSNLSSLRMRERLLAFVWGAACWFAVVLVLLVIACFVDWFIDRERETPIGVRQALLVIQCVIAVVGACVFLFWPQIRRLSDTMLALWVEAKMPEFDHRLISAVQFNQPSADLGGMSKELAAVVTREAEKQAQRIGFAQVADHSRLGWSALVVVPVVLIALVPLAIWPNVVFALLGRQLLRPIDVPHSVELASVSPDVWPIGDTIPIRYRVTGKYDQHMVGSVSVRAEGQSTDRYELKFLREDENGAIFGADVNPASTNVRYSARLYDGRTKYPSEMLLAPRPVVKKNLAWVVLPAYCDTRPNVKPKIRYQRLQDGRGDVVGIPGSAVRVRFEVERLDHQAWLVLLGPEKANSAEDDGPQPEKEKRTIQMDVKQIFEMNVVFDANGVPELVRRDFIAAETTFDLVEGLTAYRLHVKNEHDFENLAPPRRALALVPEAPPQVWLLRDTFGLGAAFDVEGLPVLLGENIRIPYGCSGPYGLGGARVLYRILKEHISGEKPAEEEPWITIPLFEEQPDATAGVFDPKTGVFEHTPFNKAMPFHALPSENPERVMGRTLGGGRMFLKTDGLRDLKGPRTLKSGDQVEYCIEVLGAPRTPAELTPVVRSETRVSSVVDEKGLFAWMQSVEDEDKRLRLLKAKQEGVFGGK